MQKMGVAPKPCHACVHVGAREPLSSTERVPGVCDQVENLPVLRQDAFVRGRLRSTQTEIPLTRDACT